MLFGYSHHGKVLICFIFRTIVQDGLYDDQAEYQSENDELFKTCLSILNNTEEPTESDDNLKSSMSSSEKSLGGHQLESTDLGTKVL